MALRMPPRMWAADPAGLRERAAALCARVGVPLREARGPEGGGRGGG